MFFCVREGKTVTVLVKTGGRRGKKEEGVSICGVRFLCLTLAGKGLFAPLAARRAARRLSGKRSITAVFEKGFPFTDIFAQYGIFQPPFHPLRCAAVRQIVCAALRAQGIFPQDAFLAVRADKGGEELERLLLSLAPCVRALALDAPGEEELAARLLFRSGLALRKSCLGADLTLSLAEGEECRDGVLALFDEKLRIGYDAPQAEPFGSEAFLAALYENGAIRGEEIAVLHFDALMS